MLRIVRALLPVVTLYVGKLIIDEVVLLAGAPSASDTLREWLASGVLDRIGWLLALEFALAVGSDVLGRVVSLLDSLLSERFSNETSLRLMEHAATLDLEDFEDSELQDRLERARRQAAGRTSLIGQLFGQAQDVITVVSFAAGLIVYAPWLIVLLAIALLPAFIGEAHFNAQSYSLNYARTPERRELDYVRQTGASVETAKEVKIFGLNEFLIERYRTLAATLLRSQPPYRDAARGLGQCADRDWYARLLRRVCLHRVAHAARRLFHRRPDVSRRLVSPPSKLVGKPADRVFASRGAGALSGRSVFLLRDRAGDRSAAEPATVSDADTRRLHVRKRRLSVSGRRALGGTQSERSSCTRGKYLRWSARTVRARPRWSSCWRASTIRMKAASCSTATICANTTCSRCAPTSASSSRTSSATTSPRRTTSRSAGSKRAMTARASSPPPSAAWPTRSSSKLPEGYDQVLGKRFRTGIDLSGGEWQKIAIARAYMRDAQLLILDEPTAALDARAEFEVFERFKELSRGKTVVLISHRFSSVRMADRIVVLVDGTIEADGTHAELVQQKGRYAELFELQAAGYR